MQIDNLLTIQKQYKKKGKKLIETLFYSKLPGAHEVYEERILCSAFYRTFFVPKNITKRRPWLTIDGRKTKKGNSGSCPIIF